MGKSKLNIKGSTKPRLHSPLLRGKSRIDEVAKLAEDIGMPLLPYQRFVLEDMLKVDKDGQFRRKSVLAIAARQNGKTHIARMRILAGLFLFGEKSLIGMSSNRGMALTTFRDLAYTIESHDFLLDKVKSIRYANGQESITLKHEFGGGRYEIVAATRDGARGRTADFLFIDELREISEEAMKAATSVTRARPNAQMLYCSNAGDAFSEVLNSMRSRAQEKPPASFGYYEYSAPENCSIWDWTGIAQANPALGYTISAETIEEAIATSNIDTVRTEILSQWVSALMSPWPAGILEETSDPNLVINPGLYTVFGFDVSPSKRNASLVAGVILPDGKIGVGILQTWESQVAVDDLKIAVDIKKFCDEWRPRMVCFDKYATQSIADKLTNAGVICEDVSGAAFYQASGELLDSLVNHRLVHNGQREFITQMENCAAKQNDSSWRIIKRKSSGDISAPIGLAMVVHQLLKPNQTPTVIF